MNIIKTITACFIFVIILVGCPTPTSTSFTPEPEIIADSNWSEIYPLVFPGEFIW